MSVNTKVNGQLVPSAGLYSVTKPIGMADIYSTEEKEIGLWVDNKPLYQKSIKLDDVTVPQSGRVLIGLGTYISNIDNVIGGEVIVIDGSTNLVLPSFQIATMSQYGLTYTINKADGIVISRGSDSGAVTRDFIATVRYTKTTDTPWSGKFVPQGYGYVSSGDIYSLEERQVGVFADGKPLYQKTFVTEKTNIVGNSTINVNSDLSSLNVDEVISYKDKLTYTISGGSGQYYSDDIARLRKAGSDYDIALSIGSATLATLKIEWTIQYTKTTDVAGSGEYVPSGDKAVHYSTEEQVVGTWIDGSTLYEICATTNIPQTSAWSSEVLTNLNIKVLIDATLYSNYNTASVVIVKANDIQSLNGGFRVQGTSRSIDGVKIRYTKTS